MPKPTMDHPLRETLARELHARPFLRIGGSASLTHFAIYADGDTAIHHALLADLCRLTGLEEPAEGVTAPEVSPRLRAPTLPPSHRSQR